MPIYTLICHDCSKTSEHIMHSDEHWAEVKCPTCGVALTRGNNRAWMIDGPSMQLQGDTVPGGCSYNYWDENLGVRVTSKQHRKTEMLKQGLQEYTPDPEFKPYRDEAAYVRKHAPKGDTEAGQKLVDLNRQVNAKRRRKQIDKVFDSAKLPPVTLD
jgi:DNA-directed RNA polymerase subunit RPC12/RpoP